MATLELGVNIGDLEGVAMRNVPPSPANYAQRAGRTGRETRTGIVAGFARGTPHDGYFFDHPDEVISGAIPPPRLNLENLAAIERHMYAENVQFKPSRYPGHGKELAEGFEDVMEFMERAHRESMEIFGRLSRADLKAKCVTPGGVSVTVWKWLRAMVEHEIHHRGQIYLYLGMLDIPTPPIYGLTSEEVRERSCS